MADIELYGDWEKAKRILRNLSDNTEEYHAVAIAMGELVADKVREYIESQKLILAPLDREYREGKIKAGGDPRTLIYTGAYVDSIKVTDIDIRGDEIDVFISVEDSVTRTGISMKQLAAYLEYGTSRMPARLPFTQSWLLMKEEVRKRANEELKAIIRRDLG